MLNINRYEWYPYAQLQTISDLTVSSDNLVDEGIRPSVIATGHRSLVTTLVHLIHE
jgi:hypothetical protein